MKRIPWTREELQALVPKLEANLKRTEEDMDLFFEEEIKPVPPMTENECFALLMGLMDQAHQRPLTRKECFLHGQILAQYRMAVAATVMGKKGRYYVIPEDAINQQVEMLNQD